LRPRFCNVAQAATTERLLLRALGGLKEHPARGARQQSLCLVVRDSSLVGRSTQPEGGFAS
jgi:hypothetical protein